MPSLEFDQSSSPVCIPLGQELFWFKYYTETMHPPSSWSEKSDTTVDNFTSFA